MSLRVPSDKPSCPRSADESTVHGFMPSRLLLDDGELVTGTVDDSVELLAEDVGGWPATDDVHAVVAAAEIKAAASAPRCQETRKFLVTSARPIDSCWLRR